MRTRSFRRPPPTGKKQLGQGRPLGFLAAWLELGATLDADQHNSLQPNGVDIEQRLAARSRLNATPGAIRFQRRERSPGPDEDLEPEVLP